MSNKSISRTAALLTALALASLFVASATAETAYNNATGLPADLYDDNGDVKGLEMLTYFLFFVGYISMGAPSCSSCRSATTSLRSTGPR